MTNEPHTSPIGIDDNNPSVVDSLISTVWDPDRQAHVTTTFDHARGERVELDQDLGYRDNNGVYWLFSERSNCFLLAVAPNYDAQIQAAETRAEQEAAVDLGVDVALADGADLELPAHHGKNPMGNPVWVLDRDSARPTIVEADLSASAGSKTGAVRIHQLFGADLDSGVPHDVDEIETLGLALVAAARAARGGK